MRLVLLVLFSTIPSLAHAQWESFDPRAAVQLGVEGGVGIVQSDSNPFSPGPALTVHGGYHFKNGLTPEMQVGFAYWTGSDQGLSVSELALSLMPGVRWGWVTDRFVTGVAAHVGYGYLQGKAGESSGSASGFAIELGFDLAFQVTRDIAIGPHFSVEKIVVSKTGNIETGELWFQPAIGASFNLP